MNLVIADTSPVHYLILIEQIALLPLLFEQIFIPATERDEMLDPQTPDTVRQWMVHPPAWLQVLPNPDPQMGDPLLAGLDPG